MISTILQYSTIDHRFLEVSLRQISKFSDDIIVPLCTRFFRGDPEDEQLLASSIDIINSVPNTTIVMFDWHGCYSNDGYYHNLSRRLGTHRARHETLLFLDADEIPDDTMSKWLMNEYDRRYTYWLTSYWYFREPMYQALQHEGCGLLINKRDCDWNLHVRTERQQMFRRFRFVNGERTPVLFDGKPLVHHYSWVRTKEEMLTKVRNWGHRGDKDWSSLIHEEFSREFNGTDFVHGYQYREVDNYFGL